MRITLKSWLMVAGALVASSWAGPGAADTSHQSVHAGRASVYKNLNPESLEKLSSPARIKAITRGNTAPMEIWRVLEHGERVECLSCIPQVAELLMDSHPKTREISAWWLRRRVLGVFGPGQVYAQTVERLNDRSAPTMQRAYAAEALGEFLSYSGVKHVARAAIEDPAPEVRLASVKALVRLNTEGPQRELAEAISDADEEVRMAALRGAIRVNVFSAPEAVLERIDDSSVRVRTRAVETLGALGARDAVGGLVALLRQDSDPGVRKAAAAALGAIGDRSARAELTEALSDSDSFVRDAARVALRRL